MKRVIALSAIFSLLLTFSPLPFGCAYALRPTEAQQSGVEERLSNQLHPEEPRIRAEDVRILVAEDEPGIRRLVEALMQGSLPAAGITANQWKMVSTLGEALEWIDAPEQRGKETVVFTDLNLEGEGAEGAGFKIISRAKEVVPRSRVVLWSTPQTQEQQQEIQRLETEEPRQLDQFFHKPLRLADIQSAIRKHVLDRLQPPAQAGAEEGGFPSKPVDFGQGNFVPLKIGGAFPYQLQPSDKVLPSVYYENPYNNGVIPYAEVRAGTWVKVRRIQTVNVPFKVLGRFAVGNLTFRIVRMGEERRDFRSPEESAGGAAVAPMSKGFLLQVWLDDDWKSLDLVHLEEGVPVSISRESMPPDIDGITQVDLEGKVGRPVSDARFAARLRSFLEAGNPNLNSRVQISWTENGLLKTAYLPRQAYSGTVSRGEARTQPRPGWNEINGKYVPGYSQAGHLQIEIMGDEVIFSDLGSSEATQIEVLGKWEQSQRQGNLHADLVKSLPAALPSKSSSEPSEISLFESSMSELLERRRDQLIVMDRLRGEVPLNPDRAARFPFEKPFEVSLEIGGQARVLHKFLVKDGELHVWEHSVGWTNAGRNYIAEEMIPVAGQRDLSIAASRVPESYRVMYIPATNTVVVANNSSYRIYIAPVAPQAGAEEGVGGWLRSLSIFSEAPAGEALSRLLETTAGRPDAAPVTVQFKGDPLPAQARLQKVDPVEALQAPRLPQGFKLYVQAGVLPAEQATALREWLGASMELLPEGRLPEDRLQEILGQIQRKEPGEPGKTQPEALLLLNRETFGRFDDALAGRDRSRIPAVIVGVRPGALEGSEFPALASYLLELLKQATVMGQLVTDRLEGSFSVDSERATWFLRSSA